MNIKLNLLVSEHIRVKHELQFIRHSLIPQHSFDHQIASGGLVSDFDLVIKLLQFSYNQASYRPGQSNHPVPSKYMIFVKLFHDLI